MVTHMLVMMTLMMLVMVRVALLLVAVSCTSRSKDVGDCRRRRPRCCQSHDERALLDRYHRMHFLERRRWRDKLYR